MKKMTSLQKVKKFMSIEKLKVILVILVLALASKPVFSKEINLRCISEWTSREQWIVFIDTDKLIASTQVRAGSVTRQLNIGSSEYWFNLLGETTFVINRRTLKFQLRDPIAYTGIMNEGVCYLFQSENKI